jgi:hypothetical protein
MCVFGRRAEGGRELMVLVVADEPREGKYGSRVAGPAAVAILKEALGTTRLGESPVADVIPGFAPSALAPRETSERPWADLLAEAGR